MRYLTSIALLLVCVIPVFGQDPETPEPEVQKTLNMVVPGHQPPTSNILFVVDTSGSMDQRQTSDAIESVCQIAETPLDDLQIAIISFGTDVHRWAGTDDINEQTGQPTSRPGWSLMPSLHNVQAARNWLQNNKDNGGTNITSAINQAFESTNGLQGAQRITQLSIIIVSDGDFSNFEALALAIERQQKLREENGLDRVAIGFFGIDVSPPDDTKVRALIGENAAHCILGYMNMVYGRPETEED